MKKLSFGASYGAPPIFCHEANEMGHIDLRDVQVSPELKRAIQRWDDAYQLTFNADYPPDSDFKSAEAEFEFTKKGRELFEKLKSELGCEYSITHSV